MTREELIDLLSDDEFDNAIDNRGSLDCIYFYIRCGFKGFDNMTDEELIDEYNERELGERIESVEV